MQVPQATTVAVDDVWRHPIRLALPDRRSHLTIIGKTGSGKSTLLLRLMQADIAAGRGVSFIDPHGQTAEQLLDLIPAHRTGDVAYFDPGDLEWPVAFNLLQSGTRRSQRRPAIPWGHRQKRASSESTITSGLCFLIPRNPKGNNAGATEEQASDDCCPAPDRHRHPGAHHPPPSGAGRRRRP
jgi:hypothetical protein